MGLLLCVCPLARAERLPLKTYTTADGLAHNVVNKIMRDSRGFLWFGTNEGLSRFDGYTFTNYGTNEGLPHPTVNDIVETRAGDYWVATNGGLCKFNPRGTPTSHVIYASDSSAAAPREPMFTVIVPAGDDRLSRAINTLLQDRAGTLWCGTLKGLFRLAQSGAHIELLPVDIGLPPEYAEQSYINVLLEDRYGTLWIGSPSGLYRRWPDGSAAHYIKSDGWPDEYVLCLLEDRRGNLWVGTARGGLVRLGITAARQAPIITRAYNRKNGLTTDWVFALYESADGKLWAGTNAGLCELAPGDETGAGVLHIYTERHGLSLHEVVSVNEDRDGNLWLGTNNVGAMKLARNGFTTFDKQDGLNYVFSFFETGAGELYAYAEVLGDQRASVFDGAKIDLLNPGPVNNWRRLGRFDGQRFTWLIPDSLRKQYLGWSAMTLALQARTGEWWFGTGAGLYLFPRTRNFAELKTAQPVAVYTDKDGLASVMVYCLYEDAQGDLWVATTASTGNGLARWERATRTLHDMANIAGLPSLKERLPTAFQADGAGNLWVGFNQGELARYRAGRFTIFTSADGLPIGRINDLYLDHAGRLWIAMTRGGLIRVDEPAAEHPSFITYTTSQGLSGNYVSAITEDFYGRMYIGTGQGLDRLDPATGRIKHYTTADGLAPGTMLAAFRAHDGQLWFGTAQGLSRFLPEPPQATAAPPILLTGLRVAGAAQIVSANGATDLHLPDLAAGENQLQIDFVGLSFAAGESLRYQYRLAEADMDWSAPTALRTINYANLAPGHYRFLVRALTSDGSVSPVPAVVTFNVRPHLWQRWWFLTLGALAALSAGYLLYRYRIARLLEVANMRTRIATDLHDDIGANLTKIAILSEVAKQQHGNGDSSDDGQLSAIARISRESVAAMSDIVWAINPQRDSVRDLVRRMRRHAEELFTSRDIGLTFTAPAQEQHLKLTVDVRRDLFLIFKEAVNNTARHAQCTQVLIALTVAGSQLALEVADDGVGFDPAGESDGQGLMSMRRRAARLGGEFEIKSAAGQGTQVRVSVPYARTAWKERRPRPT